jgi:DNA-directed RNA polymerase subunit RPC12/RpoP
MDANSQKTVTIKSFCTTCGDPLTSLVGDEVACSSCGTANTTPTTGERPPEILSSEHEEIIKFFCHHCEQKLSSPVRFAGKGFDCPTCSSRNVIPREKAERKAKERAEHEAKKTAKREARERVLLEAKEKSQREDKEKAEQNKIKVKSVAKNMVGERIRKKTASNPATSEKTSGKQKLPTPPKGVNASAQSPSPAGKANDKPVAPPKAKAANGNSLWNLFGLLKRKQVIVESPQRSTNGRTDAPKEKPNRSGPQVESAKPPTKNGAGSHAAQPMDSSSGAKSKPAKATAESMTGPSGNGSSAKLEASDREKGKKNAPQKTTSPGGPPRSTILPPVKTKKEILIGRGQAPKKPAPAASKDSPGQLAKSNRAIRLSNPVSGTNRTILPRPRDERIEEERKVSAGRRPIRLEEGESSLPAPRVKQPSAMANKVSDLLADPNLEDDPFDALLDDDFDVEKLFPEIEPIASGMSKE